MDHDGPQECCQMRKVNPGGKKCSSPGPRVDIPVVLRISSLVQNPVSNVDCQDMWSSLRALNVPVNCLCSQGYVCEPEPCTCSRPVLPWQHEREGRWWWEDSRGKECGLRKGYDGVEVPQFPWHVIAITSYTDRSAAISDIVSQYSISLSRTRIQNLATSQNTAESLRLIPYVLWYHCTQHPLKEEESRNKGSSRVVCIIDTMAMRACVKALYIKILSSRIYGDKEEFPF